jgi:hypothetical protein
METSNPKLIVVTVPNGKRIERYAFVVSKWCKDRGWKYGFDYTWHQHGNLGATSKKELHFWFADHKKATWFALNIGNFT